MTTRSKRSAPHNAQAQARFRQFAKQRRLQALARSSNKAAATGAGSSVTFSSAPTVVTGNISADRASGASSSSTLLSETSTPTPVHSSRSLKPSTLGASTRADRHAMSPIIGDRTIDLSSHDSDLVSARQSIHSYGGDLESEDEDSGSLSSMRTRSTRDSTHSSLRAPGSSAGKPPVRPPSRESLIAQARAMVSSETLSTSDPLISVDDLPSVRPKSGALSRRPVRHEHTSGLLSQSAAFGYDVSDTLRESTAAAGAALLSSATSTTTGSASSNNRSTLPARPRSTMLRREPTMECYDMLPPMSIPSSRGSSSEDGLGTPRGAYRMSPLEAKPVMASLRPGEKLSSVPSRMMSSTGIARLRPITASSSLSTSLSEDSSLTSPMGGSMPSGMHALMSLSDSGSQEFVPPPSKAAVLPSLSRSGEINPAAIALAVNTSGSLMPHAPITTRGGKVKSPKLSLTLASPIVLGNTHHASTASPDAPESTLRAPYEPLVASGRHLSDADVADLVVVSPYRVLDADTQPARPPYGMLPSPHSPTFAGLAAKRPSFGGSSNSPRRSRTSSLSHSGSFLDFLDEDGVKSRIGGSGDSKFVSVLTKSGDGVSPKGGIETASRKSPLAAHRGSVPPLVAT